MSWLPGLLDGDSLHRTDHPEARCLETLVREVGNGARIIVSGVRFFVCIMVFNANFNNISVISWRSVLLVEETGVPGENHQPVACHWQILSHNVVSSTPRHEQDLNSQI